MQPGPHCVGQQMCNARCETVVNSIVSLRAFFVFQILNIERRGVMLKHILQSLQGRFFLLGTAFMVVGFILSAGNPGLARYCFYASMFFLGYFAAKTAIEDTFQNHKLNVDLLMVLSAVGAALINYESEGAALLFIFAGAEVLEEYATSKSSKEISALMGQVPDLAQLVLESGQVKEVATETLQPGDIIRVNQGDSIPIDGLVDRDALVNEASLTGESLPVEKKAGSEVFAGTLNAGQVFQIEVNKKSNETVFSNIIRMVEEAQSNPSRIATFIDRFESKYALGVLILVPLFIVLLMTMQDLPFKEAFYRGMVLLTVASPCALIASATPATLSAISNGAKNGVLVKGGAAMESLAHMTRLYSDKTGTLTEGEFAVVDYEASDDLIQKAVYMEQHSNHPIAAAIVKHFADVDHSAADKEMTVEELAGSGLKMGEYRLGKPSLFKDLANYQTFIEKIQPGHTTVFLANEQEILAYFSLADQVRQEAVDAVDKFQKAGVEVVLLTGDNEEVASKVAKVVGIKEYVAACLPEDKINFVKESQGKNMIVGMIGDGINDAPALAQSDIGIGMGSGTSVAMESSDIVIVKNNLMKLFYSFELSQQLTKIIRQNIVFSIGVIVTLVILNLLGVLSLPIGVVCHEGSTILVILNGLRLLKLKDQAVVEKA